MTTRSTPVERFRRRHPVLFSRLAAALRWEEDMGKRRLIRETEITREFEEIPDEPEDGKEGADDSDEDLDLDDEDEEE